MFRPVLHQTLISLLLTASVGLPVDAAWLPVDGDATAPTPRITVAEDAGEVVLEIEVAGYVLETVERQQQAYTRVVLPGTVLLRQRGYPEVPVLSRSIAIPRTGEPAVRVLHSSYREVAAAPVIPSRGHLTRDQQLVRNAAPAPRAALYSVGGVFPANEVDLSAPFVLRDLRGVTVRVNPVRYDADRGTLLLLERMTVVVSVAGANDKAVRPARISTESASDAGRAGSVSGFATLYRRIFANVQPAKNDAEPAPRAAERMLIVCHDEFLAAMSPFVQWKRQRGIAVEMITVTEAGGTATGIKQRIRERFESRDGLTYVILVGDREQVPTNSGTYEGADSDGLYALLAGEDLYPELFVSRISARSSTDVATQVAKFIRYEKNPDQDDAAAWYAKAMGVASNQGKPADWVRVEGLRDELLGYGFSEVDRIYQGFNATTTDITAALNEGRSVLNYLGHGSGTGWTSVDFDREDIHGLRNEKHLPWVVDISCSNGDFALAECFAESWMRAGTPDQPRGAVGVFAASTLAPWVPPAVLQAEIVEVLCAEGQNTLGALYCAGLLKVLDQYAGLDVATQVMEQNNIFGDCSLMVRTAVPLPLTAAHALALDAAQTEFVIDVPQGAGATASITGDDVLLASATVDRDGRAVLTLPPEVPRDGTVLLTVTGFNRVPYQAALQTSGVNHEPTAELPTSVVLESNFPNPFNPRTTIAFSLPATQTVELAVFDVRGQRVATLLTGQQTAGRHEVEWTGVDTDGRRVASGVYCYRLRTAAGIQRGKMLLSK